MRLLKDPEVRVNDVARRFGVCVGTVYKQAGAVATRYKDRITILEDAEIEELYGRPQFTHDERVHYFALTPEERAVADGHYSLASRVLFIRRRAISRPRRCSSRSRSTRSRTT